MNSDDEVILLMNGGAEIDRVEYDGGPSFPDPSGASMALKDPSLDNNVGSNWCVSSTPYGAGDRGTPGAANDCPTTANPGDVIINEIMFDPVAVGDQDGEWFELFNPTDRDININGWTIVDSENDSDVIDNAGPLNLPAGGYLVLGKNGDMNANGGVPVGYDYGNSISLLNSNGAVTLLDGEQNEIDRVAYDDGVTFPDPSGAAIALVHPALDNSLGENWCVATTPYGLGDLGTPGVANDCPQPIVTPKAKKEQARDILADTLPTGYDRADRIIKRAIGHIERSLTPELWKSDSTLYPKHGSKVFDAEKRAVRVLMRLVRRDGPAAEAARTAITLLVEADDMLAQTAIDDAIANGGDPRRIEKAQKALAQARRAAEKGKFGRAIENYKRAWGHAVRSLR